MLDLNFQWTTKLLLTSQTCTLAVALLPSLLIPTLARHNLSSSDRQKHESGVMALRILSARVPGHRIVLHLRILLLALLVGAGARKYNLRTVPGFSELMSCASAALTYEVAVPPFDNCPSDAAPKSFATCMCDNRCYGQATSEINGWHDKFCSTVSPFNAVSVFRNFCSVNNGLLDPVATAVPTSDGGAITAPTASPGSEFQKENTRRL